jgi:hypothetical protein
MKSFPLDGAKGTVPQKGQRELSKLNTLTKITKNGNSEGDSPPKGTAPFFESFPDEQFFGTH